MAKPFTIFKRSSGIYYCDFTNEVTGELIRRSTGTRDYNEAQKVVLSWYKNNNVVPANASQKLKEKKEKTSMEKIALFQLIRSKDFTSDDAKDIIDALIEKDFIKSAVFTNSVEAVDAVEYLTTFWDYENSPYVREKKLKGQEIHKGYCSEKASKIRIYWIPRLEGKVLGSITVNDVKDFFKDPVVEKLAPKTVNEIIMSLTIPLKYAYYNGLTQNNCFDGIIKCSGKARVRKVLTMEEAAAVFSTNWENDSAKLANAVAFYTGMRQGEIAALRLEDIGKDRLYVRHSWSKYDGLKCCKNGDEREVMIAPVLRDMLLTQASLNPYDEGKKGFVFFGLLPGHPTDPKNWLKYFHRALESIDYENPKEICFHAWRHLWCSRVCDVIGDKRVVMAGSGHKTETMLDHYASHIEHNSAMERLNNAASQIFLPALQSLEGIDFEVRDEDIK